MPRKNLTPCIICEKAIIYLWEDTDTYGFKNKSTNLSNACNVYIQGSYGSSFDLTSYEGVICDECLDQIIQSKRLSISEEPF
jgi:hypothetical protein